MELTGQFTDKPTRSQSSRELQFHGHLADWITCGLDNSWTSQNVLMQNLEQNNSSKCDIYKFAVGELTSRESSSP